MLKLVATESPYLYSPDKASKAMASSLLAAKCSIHEHVKTTLLLDKPDCHQMSVELRCLGGTYKIFKTRQAYQ